MTESELQNLINKLKQENEIPWIEVKDSLGDLVKIGETISALANSASWKNQEYGYLIWGLENDTWKFTNTKFDLKKKKKGNEDGWNWILGKTKKRVYFEEFEFNIKGNRIYVLKIKNCENDPVEFDDISYIRIKSSNDKLKNHKEILRQILNKFDKLKKENKINKKEIGEIIGKAVKKIITKEDNLVNNETKPAYDWSAQVCEGATIQDLDKEAIEKAKKQAIEKATGSKKEILESCETDLEFLDKARITKNGQITNTAMILLGKEERAFDLIPFSQALEIIWVDMLTGQKREGGKFYPPFILSVDDLASQIRISKHDYMERIGGQPTTNRKFVPQYELKSIREALHNCIAHQDYQDNKRVVLEEYADKLYFKNGGYSKISDEEYQKMITDTFTPQDYRNEFLVRAMDTINMIERLGSGQKSIFDYARKVFLPLPDRVSDVLKNRFEYTIYGSKIDEAFAQILQDRKDLDIGMVLLLDRVQKYAKGITDKQISRDQHKILKDQRLVEGRYPKLYLSAEIMEVLGKSEEYTKISMENDFRNLFEEAILRHINKFDEIQANQVYQFAMEKFSDLVKNKSESKIKSDINNSRQKLKKNGDSVIIKNGKKSVWKKP